MQVIKLTNLYAQEDCVWAQEWSLCLWRTSIPWSHSMSLCPHLKRYNMMTWSLQCCLNTPQSLNFRSKYWWRPRVWLEFACCCYTNWKDKVHTGADWLERDTSWMQQKRQKNGEGKGTCLLCRFLQPQTSLLKLCMAKITLAASINACMRSFSNISAWPSKYALLFTPSFLSDLPVLYLHRVSTTLEGGMKQRGPWDIAANLI